jgi:hypothetical protein
MGSASTEDLPQGFGRTCWRGMEMGHPTEWEPGFLSGLGRPGRCVFVDRRYQRLEVQWRRVARGPDLRQMYQRVAKSYGGRPSSLLVGAAGWEGMVRREENGSIVHAGKYFAPVRWLVQVVLVWPGKRQRPVELAVLRSIAPQGRADPLRWQALGLRADVPAAYELIDYRAEVGRVRWDFERSGRVRAGLMLERIAMGRYWLKRPLAEWLKTQLPGRVKALATTPAECGGHGGAAVHSRSRNLPRRALGLALRRVDVAWSCPNEDRVYRVGVWQRTRRALDWPATLTVHCCQPVRIDVCPE